MHMIKINVCVSLNFKNMSGLASKQCVYNYDTTEHTATRTTDYFAKVRTAKSILTSSNYWRDKSISKNYRKLRLHPCQLAYSISFIISKIFWQIIQYGHRLMSLISEPISTTYKLPSFCLFGICEISIVLNISLNKLLNKLAWRAWVGCHHLMTDSVSMAAVCLHCVYSRLPVWDSLRWWSCYAIFMRTVFHTTYCPNGTWTRAESH